MTSWALINCILSIIVAVVITYDMTRNVAVISCPQRIGMGLISAAVVMNIGPIMARDGTPFGMGPSTPYDDWASMLLRIGMIVYFGARTISRRALSE